MPVNKEAAAVAGFCRKAAMKITSIEPPIGDSDLWHGTAMDGAVRYEWFADSLSVRVRRRDRPGSEVVYIRPPPEEMTHRSSTPSARHGIRQRSAGFDRCGGAGQRQPQTRCPQCHQRLSRSHQHPHRRPRLRMCRCGRTVVAASTSLGAIAKAVATMPGRISVRRFRRLIVPLVIHDPPFRHLAVIGRPT
jgi:hypothetical protein